MDTRQTPYYATNHQSAPIPSGGGGEYESYTSTLSHVHDTPSDNNNNVGGNIIIINNNGSSSGNGTVAAPHIASSSGSSSLNELTTGFSAGGPISQSIQARAPSSRASSIVSARPRKQHTLGSLNNNKRSRTRSPIVGENQPPPARLKLAPTNPFDYREQQQQQQLAASSRSLSAGCSLSPIERISIESFERRRSIYESEAMRANRQALSGRNSNDEDESHGDDLSLDRILAHIESNGSARPTTGVGQAAVVKDDTMIVHNHHHNHHLQPLNNHHHLEHLKLQQQFAAPYSQTYNGPNNMNDFTELQDLKKIDAASSRVTYSTSDLSSISDTCDGSSQQHPNDSNNNGGAGPENEARRKKNETERGFEIVWLNFTYSVEPNILEDPRWGKVNSLFHKERRMILKGLSGGLKSGQMVALMGPSGAGKTCLLECISGVRLTGIGGDLCLRGRKHAQLVIVPQYDDFMPQFTVEEIIAYGSKMKNGFSTDHKAITDKVIEQLGLQVCRHNNIQQCSGGQRKRVAIAQELVSMPNILILDEPTSGLDSSCCYQTMKVLRDVLDQSVHTEQPMAIVTTIHQPSAKVFKMFDLVYLLGKTGYAAYSGPPDDLLPTIRDVTGLECPQYSNPSDYMIELVSYDYGEEPVEKLIEFEKMKARQFVKDYEARAGGGGGGGKIAENRKDGIVLTRRPSRDSSGAISLHQSVKLKPSKSDTDLVIQDQAGMGPMQQRLKAMSLILPDYHTEYKNNVSVPLRKAVGSGGSGHPFFYHTLIHFHRSFLQSIRDPILNNMRILIHIGFATLLVLLYGKKSGEARGCPPVIGLPTEITDPNNESMIDLADNVGYLFMCIMMITYVSLMSTVLTFPIDIKTVGKEYKNGWYGTVTYFLGKSLADLPFIVVYPLVYCLITWYMTNQASDHAWRYFSFTGLIIMNAMNSQSFGLILGALFVNSVTAATFLGPVITIPWYLFTGFTKRIHRLAEPYRTTSKFLFTRYIFEGLLDTVYGHQRCNCSEFLQEYYDLRYEEAIRLGQLVSVETLSSLDYYDGLEVVASDVRNRSLIETGSQWFKKTVDAASTVFADGEDLNLAGLMESNVKASSIFSFGLDFEPTCPSNYRNYVVQDFRLNDDTMENAFITTLCMLAVIRVLTFILVAWKIRTRQL